MVSAEVSTSVMSTFFHQPRWVACKSDSVTLGTVLRCLWTVLAASISACIQIDPDLSLVYCMYILYIQYTRAMKSKVTDVSNFHQF